MNAPRGSHAATFRRRSSLACSAVLATVLLGACAAPRTASHVFNAAQLTPATPSTSDLLKLPLPAKKTVVAVYGFRDETGQYKPSPDSSFSTAVTQGAASMLIKALNDSRWFIPVEREGLQELLTERRIIRAEAPPVPKGARPVSNVPSLMAASIMIGGGIVAYESNVRTGGIGANFLGIGLSTQYRVDQVTVNLRSINVDTGQILDSVSTTKTIFSYEINPSVYKFVNFKDLLQIEAGVTNNEPAQLCVKEAIEAAVLYLTVQGLKDHTWALRNPNDWNSPIIQHYANNEKDYALTAMKPTETAISSRAVVQESP
ncbi:MAG: curli production assembly/transport protein CsgG [Candidimonas sp.]|nr:MAG: curli production assembly/transport protein CsgG [Candidimonas sp.]TAM22744.1 MAG: curli production assembly/transport protein CsgG [Candidimonas sp.]TAM74522.1 MAG: curli production assembly/transport protein CsgG [Candidimonas sp.]